MGSSSTNYDWYGMRFGETWGEVEKLTEIHGFDIYGNKQTHVKKTIEWNELKKL